VTSVPELGALANNLTHSYSDLATESCRIARVCPAPQVRSYLVFLACLSVCLPKMPFMCF